jgi:hypothetical protein
MKLADLPDIPDDAVLPPYEVKYVAPHGWCIILPKEYADEYGDWFVTIKEMPEETPPDTALVRKLLFHCRADWMARHGS